MIKSRPSRYPNLTTSLLYAIWGGGSPVGKSNISIFYRHWTLSAVPKLSQMVHLWQADLTPGLYYDGREWWRVISVLICIISYSRTQSSNPSNCLIILHNLILPLLSKHSNTINSIWPHTVNRHQAQFICCYPLLCNYSWFKWSYVASEVSGGVMMGYVLHFTQATMPLWWVVKLRKFPHHSRPA